MKSFDLLFFYNSNRMSFLRFLSFICYSLFFVSSPTSCIILVEDAIDILTLIQQAEFKDDYLQRTRNSFVELAQPNLLLLRKDPSGLMTIFKIITATQAQAYLEDISACCSEFTFALQSIPEYNQYTSDLAVLSQYLFEYIKKVFVEFNLLKEYSTCIEERML